MKKYMNRAHMDNLHDILQRRLQLAISYTFITETANNSIHGGDVGPKKEERTANEDLAKYLSGRS